MSNDWKIVEVKEPITSGVWRGDYDPSVHYEDGDLCVCFMPEDRLWVRLLWFFVFFRYPPLRRRIVRIEKV